VPVEDCLQREGAVPGVLDESFFLDLPLDAIARDGLEAAQRRYN
jgi:hypothetical protein